MYWWLVGYSIVCVFTATHTSVCLYQQAVRDLVFSRSRLSDSLLYNYAGTKVSPLSLIIFSHTMSECDSGHHPVCIVFVGGMDFFSFSTSSLKPLHGFSSNFVWIFLGWTPTKYGCYPYSSWNYG